MRVPSPLQTLNLLAAVYAVMPLFVSFIATPCSGNTLLLYTFYYVVAGLLERTCAELLIVHIKLYVGGIEAPELSESDVNKCVCVCVCVCGRGHCQHRSRLPSYLFPMIPV